ncbi:O-antigen ligase family protein [Demequina sp. B12]|uniref:O-antigen ligase family protein n=1 Tax=Demequina sp. B12 TaxID=2992757 RepID=UPI00237B138B|nr:O-antigen ligase family protein [Demequina sp. B12]MDE0572916.1 O-antigen ligase family protein [Demequina sp. B12]
MTTLSTARAAVAERLVTRQGREALIVWAVVLLMSGQGFRYMLGVPGFMVLCAVTIAAYWVGFKAVLPRTRFPILVLGFVALGALSMIWTATPLVTFLAVVITIVTTVIAAVSVQATGGPRFLDLLYRGLQWCLLLGIAFELFVTVVVKDQLRPLGGDFSEYTGLEGKSSPFMWSENNLVEGGPIQGFVGNRNPFGAIALFTAILAAILYLERRISRRNAWITLASAGAVHLLTMSATVTVVAVAVLILAGLGAVIRKADPAGKRTISVSFVAMLMGVAWLVVAKAGVVLDMLNRDPDMTNRTDIWERVVEIASLRPEGWGFVGVWPIWEEPYSAVVADTTARATHAHNAYLDAWLQMGIAGAVLLVALMLFLLARAWRVVEYGRPGDTWLPLGWLLLTGALAIQALAESKMLVEGGWFMLVALTCIVPRMRAITFTAPHRARTGIEWAPRELMASLVRKPKPSTSRDATPEGRAS